MFIIQLKPNLNRMLEVIIFLSVFVLRSEVGATEILKCVRLELHVNTVLRVPEWTSNFDQKQLCWGYENKFLSKFASLNGEAPERAQLDTCQTARGFKSKLERYFILDDPLSKRLKDTHEWTCLADRHLPYLRKACEWTRWKPNDFIIHLYCQLSITFLSLHGGLRSTSADPRQPSNLGRQRPRFGGAGSHGLYNYLLPQCENAAQICDRVASTMTGSGERWSCVSTDVFKWTRSCRDMGPEYWFGTTTILPTGRSLLPQSINRRIHEIAKSKPISLGLTSRYQSSSLLTCAGPSRFSRTSLTQNVQRRDLEPFPSRGDFHFAPKLVSTEEMDQSVFDNIDELDRLDEASTGELPIKSKKGESRKGKEIARSKSKLPSISLASTSKGSFSDDSSSDYMTCESDSSISENLGFFF